MHWVNGLTILFLRDMSSKMLLKFSECKYEAA